jgi:hypothetical protein
VKVLHLNMHFLLDPDFEGNIADALQELSVYLLCARSALPHIDIQDPTSVEAFLSTVAVGGRISGHVGMAKDDGVKWKKLPTGIPELTK